MNPVHTRRLDLLFRIGVALCFIGHGVFGLLRKDAWVPYFAVFGIETAGAHMLMPIIGGIDIGVGLTVLLWPTRALLAYGVLWCTATAALRPLAGEPLWELLERAGNYGSPLALLVWVGSRSDISTWVRRIRTSELNPQRVWLALQVARWSTATLLVGHGMLALARKPLLVDHMAALGLGADTVILTGVIDLMLAALCVARPGVALFGLIAVWKLGTEALFVVSGAPIWEFIERGGSYAMPLAGAAILLALDASARTQAAVPKARRPAEAAFPLALLGVALLAAGLAATPAAAQQTPTGSVVVPPSFDNAVAAELLRGGYVLACRHGLTDRQTADQRPLRFDDPSTQRVLSAAGERQMRAAGEHIARAGLALTDVLTSPYQRTRRSAELMFGRATVEDALYGRGKPARESLFHSVVAPGGNRVLMTHQGVLYGVLPLRRGSIEEGDCIMVRPTGSALEVIARIKPEDWEHFQPAR